MYKYIDNKSVRKEIDKLLIDINISKAELARKMDCKPQQLNNILNKRNFALSDLQRIYNALGYDLIIDIQPKDGNTTP